MMKITVLMAALLITLFGFVLPWLFSQKHDLPVFIGLAIILISLLLTTHALDKQLKKEKKDEDEQNTNRN